jgi:WD40 repeat protein/tRNA A-37 threonylcarbamoyl transferase component Bud32
MTSPTQPPDHEQSTASALGLTEAEGGRDITPSALPSPPELPDLEGHPRYQILEQLGRGGMGAVYKARHRLMERPVALKIINRDLMNHPTAVERFQREVRAAANLTHPNIVTAFDAEQAGNTHFLVMEFIPGTDLARVVSERGPLPLAKACEYVRQAALGLQHAYEHGMVHRDIKPHNLMLTPDGKVKILDFGLARLASAVESQAAYTLPNQTNASLTATGSVLGTVDYMAPEQVRDAHAADIRADIYSLGCTLYYLLTSQLPFPTGDALQKMNAHVEQEPRPLGELRPDLPKSFLPIVAKMMHKLPSQRYQTPGEVAAALASFAASQVQRYRYKMRAVVAALVVVLGGLLASAMARWLIPAGELRIEAEDSVKVLVYKDDGRNLVATVDARKRDSLRLRPGEYSLIVEQTKGEYLLSQRQVRIEDGGTATVRVDRAPPPLLQAKEIHCFRPQSGPVVKVDISADGRHGLAVLADGTIRLWNLETHEEIRPPRLQAKGVRAAIFSPVNDWVASAGADKAISIWDRESGLRLHHITSHKAAVRSLAFSPDGRTILAGEDGPDLHLWDVESGKELWHQGGHAGQVHCVAFSPDGEFALSTDGIRGQLSPGTLRLWNVETGQMFRPFTGHKRAVLSAAISPDSRWVLSGSEDETVRLWKIASGRLEDERNTEMGWPEAVCFHPDGRHFITAGSFMLESLKVWNLKFFKAEVILVGHSQAVNSVACSRDGRKALSGSSDGTVRLWSLPDWPK